MAKSKKTFIATATLIGPAPLLPDFGLGKGVLGTEEIRFTDGDGAGFDSTTFYFAKEAQAKRMREDLVNITWVEKKRTTKKGRK